jgi:hypothetical protein
MPKSDFLIDPPSPFADLEEWREYLAELLEAVKEHGAQSDLAEAIADAEKTIAEKTK